MKLLNSIVIGVWIVWPSAISAFCSEPSFYGSEPSFPETAPSAPSSYQKPTIPYCLSSYSYSGTHTCEEYELDAYFAEVNEYIDHLNEYVAESVEFSDAATAYAKEAIEFANSATEFADEVYSYSECEAENVKQQHE